MLARGWELHESEPLPVALLRAPAAVGVIAFAVGLGAGAFAAPFTASAAPALTYVLATLICAPFVFPTPWYHRYRLLWVWMAAAAAVVTVRAVFMAGFLLPHQPAGAWALKTAMDLGVAAILWLAAFAVRRT